MNSKFLQEVTEWFIAFKAPDLKEKARHATNAVEEGIPLGENYKKFLAFMLFSYSMNKGPVSFLAVEEEAERIGVTEQFKEYANDWITHSKNQKQS